MKHGNWIPISKGFKKSLPHDREYTELEAAYSLQLDYDSENTVTVAGYSDLWRWSRKRVYRFLERMNIKITYPEDTAKKQNQKGFIGVQIPPQIRDRCGADKGQIRLIENNNLEEGKNRKGADKGQIRDRSGSTTIDPLIPEPKKRIFNQKEFDVFYSAYPKKTGKKEVLARWQKLIKSGDLPCLPEILAAIKKQTLWRESSNGAFRPEWKNPATWLNKGCWEDEIDTTAKKTKTGYELNFNGK